MRTTSTHGTEDLCDTPARLVREGLITATAAAKLSHANASTIVRWGIRGIRTLNGERLRLEIVRLGGRVMTSEAALLRFIGGQQVCAPDAAPVSRTPAERRRAAVDAAKQLEDSGA